MLARAGGSLNCNVHFHMLALDGVYAADDEDQPLEITSMHSKAGLIAEALTKVSMFLKRIKETAEQLTEPERWRP